MGPGATTGAVGGDHEVVASHSWPNHYRQFGQLDSTVMNPLCVPMRLTCNPMIELQLRFVLKLLLLDRPAEVGNRLIERRTYKRQVTEPVNSLIAALSFLESVEGLS